MMKPLTCLTVLVQVLLASCRTIFFAKLSIDPARFEISYARTGTRSLSECAESTAVFRTNYPAFSYNRTTETCSMGTLGESDQAPRTATVCTKPSKYEDNPPHRHASLQFLKILFEHFRYLDHLGTMVCLLVNLRHSSALDQGENLPQPDPTGMPGTPHRQSGLPPPRLLGRMGQLVSLPIHLRPELAHHKVQNLPDPVRLSLCRSAD